MAKPHCMRISGPNLFICTKKFAVFCDACPWICSGESGWGWCSVAIGFGPVCVSGLYRWWGKLGKYIMASIPTSDLFFLHHSPFVFNPSLIWAAFRNTSGLSFEYTLIRSFRPSLFFSFLLGQNSPALSDLVSTFVSECKHAFLRGNLLLDAGRLLSCGITDLCHHTQPRFSYHTH